MFQKSKCVRSARSLPSSTRDFAMARTRSLARFTLSSNRRLSTSLHVIPPHIVRRRDTEPSPRTPHHLPQPHILVIEGGSSPLTQRDSLQGGLESDVGVSISIPPNPSVQLHNALVRGEGRLTDGLESMIDLPHMPWHSMPQNIFHHSQAPSDLIIHCGFDLPQRVGVQHLHNSGMDEISEVCSLVGGKSRVLSRLHQLVTHPKNTEKDHTNSASAPTRGARSGGESPSHDSAAQRNRKTRKPQRVCPSSVAWCDGQSGWDEQSRPARAGATRSITTQRSSAIINIVSKSTPLGGVLPPLSHEKVQHSVVVSELERL